jgi:hypothetical protein
MLNPFGYDAVLRRIMFDVSLNLWNASSFPARSVQLIFSILYPAPRFKNFVGISDLFSEVSKFQDRTKLCSKCNTLPVSSWNLSQVCWWKVFFSDADFVRTIFDIISRVQLASFVILLHRYLKYSAFSGCFLSTTICTGDGCLRFPLPYFFPHPLYNRPGIHNSHFKINFPSVADFARVPTHMLYVIASVCGMFIED